METQIAQNSCNKLSIILRQLMKLHHINESELSRQTGIPQTTINRILQKNADPKTKTLAPICKFFGIILSQLIGEIPLDNSYKEKWNPVPIISWDHVYGWNFIKRSSTPTAYKFLMTDKEVSNQVFAIKTLSSMQPIFRKDSYLIVDPIKTPSAHSFVLAYEENSPKNPIIKKVVYNEQKEISFISPLGSAKEDSNNIHIIGLIIECRLEVINI